MCLQAGYNRSSPNDVMNIMGALFLCLVFMGYSNLSGTLPIVCNARTVFYREKAANMYCVEAFALANVSQYVLPTCTAWRPLPSPM